VQLKRFLDDQFSLGKGAVKLPISSLLEQYRKRYAALRQVYKTFKYTIWYVQPEGRTIVHFKVPSETVHNFFYDVLLELDRSGGAAKFEDCHVKVFSNCPSFVYTYAHVFYTMKDPDTGKDGMIIDKFNQKIPKERLLVKGSEKTLPKESLTDAPTTRNPANLNLPDKSIYYAIFYLIDEFDFRRVMYSRNTISMSRLLQSVDNFDILMKNRRAMELKQREQLRETRKVIRKAARQKEAEINQQSGLATVNRIKPTRPIRSQRSGNVTRVKAISPVSRRKK
jgi:hypothetical protein